jgi:hypothetical protein
MGGSDVIGCGTAATATSAQTGGDVHHTVRFCFAPQGYTAATILAQSVMIAKADHHDRLKFSLQIRHTEEGCIVKILVIVLLIIIIDLAPTIVIFIVLVLFIFLIFVSLFLLFAVTHVLVALVTAAFSFLATGAVRIADDLADDLRVFSTFTATVSLHSALIV